MGTTHRRIYSRGQSAPHGLLPLRYLQIPNVVGYVSRTQLIENVPAILQYDSLTYFRPNIAGALFQYIHTKGFAEALYRLETSTDRGKTRGFHGCIQRPVATPALPFRRRAFGDESLGSSS